MPRQASLDSPGTLHHVIIRGIERRRIVEDGEDRENFVGNWGLDILTIFLSPCYKPSWLTVLGFLPQVCLTTL